MGRRESKVERYLDQQIKAIGGITRKWVSPGHDGVPDRIALTPKNGVIFIEVKTIDGTLSPIQYREIKRLQAYNACVEIVYGVEGVDKLINKLRR